MVFYGNSISSMYTWNFNKSFVPDNLQWIVSTKLLPTLTRCSHFSNRLENSFVTNRVIGKICYLGDSAPSNKIDKRTALSYSRYRWSLAFTNISNLAPRTFPFSKNVSWHAILNRATSNCTRQIVTTEIKFFWFERRGNTIAPSDPIINHRGALFDDCFDSIRTRHVLIISLRIYGDI